MDTRASNPPPSSSSPATAAAFAFVRAAAAQRVNLELALETAPRDSRYSPALVDLMRKEEIALKDNPKLARDLAPRVDEMLSHETRAFFHKTVQQNLKRWQGLQDKLLADIRKLGLDQQPPASAASTSSVSPDGASNSSSHPQKVIDLDLEEKRLEADYNLNWAYYEDFHLREAFKLQAERVDRDWAQHEDDLRNDYVSRRAGLLGLSMVAARQQLQAEEAANSSSQGGHSSPVRWQHAEKQKTLVHTAPVLSPVRKDSTGSGKGAATRRTGQTQAEVRYILFRIILL